MNQRNIAMFSNYDITIRWCYSQFDVFIKKHNITIKIYQIKLIKYQLPYLTSVVHNR